MWTWNGLEIFVSSHHISCKLTKGRIVDELCLVHGSLRFEDSREEEEAVTLCSVTDCLPS